MVQSFSHHLGLNSLGVYISLLSIDLQPAMAVLYSLTHQGRTVNPPPEVNAFFDSWSNWSYKGLYSSKLSFGHFLTGLPFGLIRSE